jgi:DNA-binding response OmpR family regulator
MVKFSLNSADAAAKNSENENAGCARILLVVTLRPQMSGLGNSKGRILIADDDEAFRLATRAFLRQQGYECEMAADAIAATELLRGSEFDLLISDINMPGNVSLELIQQLPELAAALPVIVLTGHPTVQSAARSVRLQVVAYLVKPPEPDELLDLAEKAVANYRSYRAVSANRQRLENWVHDIARLEEVLRKSTSSADAPKEAFLNLTLQNMLGVLVDLKQFTEAFARKQGGENMLEQIALHRALQETIEVLEKTKRSFKSKELGELRRKLEGLLQTPPTGGMKPDSPHQP